MSELKITTFNIEWMFSIFGALWKDWDNSIPVSFPGKQFGPIKLEPIDDVHGLCRRIAEVIKAIKPDILGIQEGPPRKDQMLLFVREFLEDQYDVLTSNSTTQTIYALVHKSISENVSAKDPYNDETKSLWSRIPYQPWMTIAKEDCKNHRFHRRPLMLTFTPEEGKQLELLVVHTKSKYSKLKDQSQWENREEDAVLEALDARQKLSAEVYRLREYIEQRIGEPNVSRALLVMGDFNDGPLAEVLEREFLIHNIIDELVGSILTPNRIMKHAMSPPRLESSTTAEFSNPFKDNEITKELIDHIVVSPGIWDKQSPFQLIEDSCRVEDAIYNRFNEEHGSEKKRHLRPSDHRPLSAILEY